MIRELRIGTAHSDRRYGRTRLGLAADGCRVEGLEKMFPLSHYLVLEYRIYHCVCLCAVPIRIWWET